MGDEPNIPTPPPSPDYAQANREGIVTDVATLPARNSVNNAAMLGLNTTIKMPQFDSQGNISGYTDMPVDFTGLGNRDLSLNQANTNAATSDINAQSALALQQKYGSQFSAEQLKRIQESDPTGFSLRQNLAQKLTDDLNLGSGLSDQEQRQAEQSVRAGQVARGNYTGTPQVVQEAIQKFNLGNQLKNQRQAAASSYVFGSPITNQFGNINQAQQGAAPNVSTNVNAGQLNPNAGQLGTQFALQRYGTQSNIWATQAGIAASQPTLMDQIGQGVGIAGSVAGSVMGGMAM